MSWASELFAAIGESWVYLAALVFFAAYPLITSIIWITTSQFFRLRWEGGSNAIDRSHVPRVSVLIPAYNEEAVIANALRAACAMDYPDFEVVVVNDGSRDATLERLQPFLARGDIRLVNKSLNEGKALAMNDAIPCLTGEIVLILDADAEPEPDLLWRIVPHFAAARVGAVTGNPRVKNSDTFLSRLQLIEFTSIVSLLRRSQRIWGRIETVSGVVSAFRRSALVDAGGFSPEMATEDIELTWKLQKRFWDVRYEPRAIIWMTVPTSLKGLWRQRLRWARGLMQVLRKHREVITTWKLRRMWPIFIESSLSALWALCFVSLSVIWLLSYAAGVTPVGAHPIPNLWGMAIATLCLLQLLVGVLTDRPYDRGTLRFFPYAVFYPLVYWMLLSLCTVAALPHLFRQPRQLPTRWNTARVDGEESL